MAMKIWRLDARWHLLVKMRPDCEVRLEGGS